MTVWNDTDELPIVKVAVVGCGNWGKNLVRNFHSLNFLHTVCDKNTQALRALQPQYKGIHFTDNFQEVLENPEIHGVVISTPSVTHYGLAKEALLAGKHVYVEKPVATTCEHVLELFSISEEQDRVLMVGHLLLYHPAVTRLRQLIQEGALGHIKKIQSDRLNTNLNRPDKSVIWDLAPHDLSMISYLLDEDPEDIVSAIGYRNREDGLIDDAHIDLTYPNEVGGHIHISWVHPIKQVKLVVHGTKRTAMIDDTQSQRKLQLFNKDDLTTPIEEFPEYLSIEPLKLECQHFINCIRSGKRPKTDGLNGYQVVRILEKAEEKMELISV